MTQFLSPIYALFWHTFYRPKKYGGVPKMTNMRYDGDEVEGGSGGETEAGE